MRRLATFPVLFLPALGCVLAAWVLAPHGCDPKPLPAASLVLIVLGGVLAFGSVAVPFLRSVRTEGGRVGVSTLVIGVGSGLGFAWLLVLVPTIVLLGGGTECGG